MLDTHDLPGLAVSFHCQFVRLIRVLQCALRMPISSLVIPFFIMFGGCTVGLGRKFVLLGGSAMCLVCVMHCVFLMELSAGSLF